jgi:hypothetical protein
MYDMQMASSQYTGQHVGQYAGVAAGYKTYGFEGHSSKNQAHWNEELAKQKRMYYKERQQANRQVAAVLVFIMVTGTLLQYKRLQSSYEAIGEQLDEQSHQLGLQYEKVRQQARSNTIHEQLHQMLLQSKHDYPDRRRK